jgi:hypothetical protein
MDDVTWGALAAGLTLLLAAYSLWAFRHRGAAAGTRGAALTLLPAAAWLTGTLRMFTRIVDAVGDWATHLVFSPTVWAGTFLAGLSAVLWVIGGFLHGRNAARAGAAGPAPVQGSDAKPLPASRQGKGKPVIDDDMAEIEAILKNRGIS